MRERRIDVEGIALADLPIVVSHVNTQDSNDLTQTSRDTSERV